MISFFVGSLTCYYVLHDFAGKKYLRRWLQLRSSARMATTFRTLLISPASSEWRSREIMRPSVTRWLHRLLWVVVIVAAAAVVVVVVVVVVAVVR